MLARGGSLLRFAYLLCGDFHLAEDLVQEALARACRKWKRVECGNPDAYLRKAIVRMHISWWRRRSNREAPSGEIAATEVVDDFTAGHALREELWAQLKTLSRKQRAVLVLRYFHDLDDDAIAQVLGCAPATARVHAHRGLAALRSRLSRTAEEAIR